MSMILFIIFINDLFGQFEGATSASAFDVASREPAEVHPRQQQELLSHWQAGFRNGRSATDQILRLTQYVFDGFQTKEKIVACIFDYSKAYDTVWRTGLLRKMRQLGVPHRFIE